MVDQQLLDYIKQQLQQGENRERIKNSLLVKGWQMQDIDEAFSFISNPASQSSPVMPPAQTISSLPSATAILGQAWTIYKQRLGTFLGVMAIPILIMVVFLVVIIGGGFLSISLLFSKFAAGSIGLIIFLAILFFVIIFITQVWGQTALLYAIKDSQEKIGIMKSYRRGWHKILSYWWVSLLMGFITLGGFFLLIVPGIIFAIWFSLAVFILIAEDLKGMNALLKSREYVKGKWGGVLWRIFFIIVVSFLISLAPTLFFSLLKIPFGSEISSVVIGLFLTPLVITYLFLVYSNLKALKGKIIFAPTGGKKAVFILIGILGILGVLGTLFIPIIFLQSSRFSTLFHSTTIPQNQPIIPDFSKVEYKDCGPSDDCFSDYVKTCTPAKATINYQQGFTYIETVEGYEGDNCILTFTYTEFPIPTFIGKEATCKIPKSNLVNFKDYFQGKNTKQSCEGSLIDLLIQTGAI